MNDDGPFYCARCLSLLGHSGCGEEYCPKCDTAILAAADYLTHEQWTERRNRDRVAFEDALRDGLIRTEGE